MFAPLPSIFCFLALSLQVHLSHSDGGKGRKSGECELLRKETLCESRGEPVRRFTFRVPPGFLMDADAGLRQVVVVSALGQRRMYSPTSEPLRPDGTFELVVRIYRGGRVSQWLDQVPVKNNSGSGGGGAGGGVPMVWPFPSPLPPDRRNGAHTWVSWPMAWVSVSSTASPCGNSAILKCRRWFFSTPPGYWRNRRCWAQSCKSWWWPMGGDRRRRRGTAIVEFMAMYALGVRPRAIEILFWTIFVIQVVYILVYYAIAFVAMWTKKPKQYQLLANYSVVGIVGLILLAYVDKFNLIIFFLHLLSYIYARFLQGLTASLVLLPPPPGALA